MPKFDILSQLSYIKTSKVDRSLSFRFFGRLVKFSRLSHRAFLLIIIVQRRFGDSSSGPIQIRWEWIMIVRLYHAFIFIDSLRYLLTWKKAHLSAELFSSIRYSIRFFPFNVLRSSFHSTILPPILVPFHFSLASQLAYDRSFCLWTRNSLSAGAAAFRHWKAKAQITQQNECRFRFPRNWLEWEK